MFRFVFLMISLVNIIGCSNEIQNKQQPAKSEIKLQEEIKKKTRLTKKEQEAWEEHKAQVDLEYEQLDRWSKAGEPEDWLNQ